VHQCSMLLRDDELICDMACGRQPLLSVAPAANYGATLILMITLLDRFFHLTLLHATLELNTF